MRRTELLSSNDDNNERRLSAKDLILKYVDSGEGPYWRHACSE